MKPDLNHLPTGPGLVHPQSELRPTQVIFPTLGKDWRKALMPKCQKKIWITI